MLRFREWLVEAGGQAAGKLELVKTSLGQAKEFAQQLLDEPLDQVVPDFDTNYKLAQKRARLGKTQRKDMPVIDTSDVRNLQTRLKKGMIDIEKPKAPSTDPRNPFPEGLSGSDAKRFLERGLNDKDISDDIVKTAMKRVAVKDLKPIQKQIFFDKSFKDIAKFGPDGTKKFLKDVSIFICSSDYYIIDGHHRFLSGLLVEPAMKVRCLTIDLPINKLLPMSLAFGDAIGNKRNA